MEGLVFHWDDAAAFSKSDMARKKLLKQWTHTAKAFGVYNLMIIGDPASIPVVEDLEMTVQDFATYDAVRAAYPTHVYVVMTEVGEPIESITFPAEPSFLVAGSNYANPVINEGDITVSITALLPLWDVVAAGIVLHKAQ